MSAADSAIRTENTLDQCVEAGIGAEVIELEIGLDIWHPVGALCTAFVQQGKCLILLSKGCKDRSFTIVIEKVLRQQVPGSINRDRFALILIAQINVVVWVIRIHIDVVGPEITIEQRLILLAVLVE